MMQLRGLRRVVTWCLAALAVGIGPCAGEVFAQSGPDMTLTGILIGPTPVAIIRADGHTFITKVGEPVGDAVVVAILPAKVVLRRGNVTRELPAPSAARVPRSLGVSRGGAAPVPAVPPKGAVPTAVPPRSAPLASTPPRAATPAPPGMGMTVTGILEGKHRVAIVQAGGQSYVAGAGDPVGDAVVVSILPHKVVLKKNGALFELPLGGTAGRKTSGQVAPTERQRASMRRAQAPSCLLPVQMRA